MELQGKNKVGKKENVHDLFKLFGYTRAQVIALRMERIEFFEQCVQEVCADEWVQLLAQNPQHGQTSRLQHSISVAYHSFLFCEKLHLTVDTYSLIRGALLHDFFLYNWKDDPKLYRRHGTRHPKAALANAEARFVLTSIERDIITKHMFPLTIRLPKYRESYVICLWDKICCVQELLHVKNRKLAHLLPSATTL